MSALPVVLVEKDAMLRESISKLLQGQCRITSSELGELAKLASKCKPALSIIGPTSSAIHEIGDIVLRVRKEWPGNPLLLLTGISSEALAIAALRAGVNGYLSYPCRSEELSAELQRCLSIGAPVVACSCDMPEMVGDSEAMRTIRAYLSRVALTDSNVLITGETGTGKELAAAFVHRSSDRKDRPSVTVNCAAIPDGLLESELFGYERGAFTGAHAAQQGKLKAAHRGTIFLDEIGDMTAYAQAKILRVTENKEIQRLGSSIMTPVDVRIVAATNQDLEALVKEGKFRKDLFFRLNVGRVHLPPLRERQEDIPAIASHYLQVISASLGGHVRCLTEDAWCCMLSYTWPGNVRELKNVLEMVLVHASQPEISARDLPSFLREQGNELCPALGDERKRLVSALAATDWNKSRAAEQLHWSRMTLYRKMAKYQVSKSLAECAV